MTVKEAEVEVFAIALKALGRKGRRRLLELLLKDPALRRDVLDAIIIEERRNQPARPLDEFLK
jgi:hypothetical protein